MNCFARTVSHKGLDAHANHRCVPHEWTWCGTDAFFWDIANDVWDEPREGPSSAWEESRTGWVTERNSSPRSCYRRKLPKKPARNRTSTKGMIPVVCRAKKNAADPRSAEVGGVFLLDTSPNGRPRAPHTVGHRTP